MLVQIEFIITFITIITVLTSIIVLPLLVAIYKILKNHILGEQNE